MNQGKNADAATGACSIETTLNVFNVILFLSYVEERPWWPIQSPNKRRKRKAKRRERSDQVY